MRGLMGRCGWRGGKLWQKFKSRVDEEWFILKISYFSLFYNSLTSWYTTSDAAMEPIFWFVDHFVRYLGPAFVILVLCLTSSVVAIFYICLLPHKFEHDPLWAIYHLVVGHWVLANIVFHYFKAAFTDPGVPPNEIPVVGSLCKKCIGPKPPRTHHCSVCGHCILKMDHHCPWLNNCVGHYNHRYFFLFCAYMWLGTVYVSIVAYPMFAEHFYGDQELGYTGVFYPYHMAKRTIAGDSEKSQHASSNTSIQTEARPTRHTLGLNFHQMVMYEFMLCSAVSVALLLLLLWHARLIGRAETSIEVHINRREQSRLKRNGLVFRNPYSFGFRKNWKTFLGVTKGRSFWRHVLLPSSHPPDEDGLKWRTIFEAAESDLMAI